MPHLVHGDQIFTRVLAEKDYVLEAKPINLPDLPTNHDEPEPDWHSHLMRGIERDTEREWRELYIGIQAHRIEYWEKLVRAFEAKPFDLYNAWNYLNHHPAFWHFYGKKDMTAAERIHEKWLIDDDGVRDSITLTVMRINPDTQRYDDHPELNTQTQVWVEIGKHGWPHDDENTGDANWHDTDLDGGADDLDTAIIYAAVMVHTAYGNDRQVCDKED